MARVLLVDDDAAVLDLVRRGLERRGHDVSEASDWPTMNDSLFHGDIDVLVLDVQLPGLRGDQLLEILQKQFTTRLPDVVLHSGLDEQELRAIAERLKVPNYVQKGAGYVKVVNVVDDLTRQRRNP